MDQSQNNNQQVQNAQNAQNAQNDKPAYETIFCSTCGAKIAKVAISCPHCGSPVAQNQQQPQVIINNSNTNTNTNANTNTNSNGNGPAANRFKNKWVAFLLCLFLGFFGAHKFYEGKILLGIVYIFTGGLFFIGWIIDLIALLFKPNPYFV